MPTYADIPLETVYLVSLWLEVCSPIASQQPMLMVILARLSYMVGTDILLLLPSRSPKGRQPGFFLCIFSSSLYVNLSLRKNQDIHSRVMFSTIVLMFVLATLHVSVNCHRMIEAYVIHRDASGGPALWMGILSRWSYVFKDALFVSMEILGDATAIYRTFVIWGRDWRPIAISCALFIWRATAHATYTQPSTPTLPCSIRASSA
ncbi:hypothetical protein NM688_g8470 [Phlebia brevispora]|uniref:Uncharacterized protein n=1 Tax=Phlebia brevispora TaxID=194682 RepID=A0ACC1RSF2_9APHY|nr:hypothetical protein NM688_g8470 [Phlebia brevispora]